MRLFLVSSSAGIFSSESSVSSSSPQVLPERDLQHPQQKDLQLLPLSIVSDPPAWVLGVDFLPLP